jgi:hypothetical protein
MKKRIITTVLAAIFMAAVSNAAVWRVSNISGADTYFTSIQHAMDSIAFGEYAVQPYDTLYIEPSATVYPAATLTRPVVIIGNGYFLDENFETQANPTNSRISGINFNAGSSGSAIMGCVIADYVSVNESNIRIERNYIVTGAWGQNSIDLGINISDILVISNYIYNSAGSSANCINGTGSGVNNLLIAGNYLHRTGSGSSIVLGSGVSALIENNVMWGPVSIHNSIFSNNILRSGNFSANNSVFHHNLGNAEQFGQANGNQSNINMDNVFLGEGSTDGQWQLKPGSPAIGAGTAGQDCGMFDGTYPYVLSGIPPIPAIYEYLQIYNSATQEIEVNFSVKSHN